MYEALTYDFILSRMLGRIPNTVDKREGSIIYDALAPAAAELAQMYIELDINLSLSFADTATGEYLTRRAAEFGVLRYPATRVRRRGLFYANNDVPLNVPVGSRYSIEDVTYTVLSSLGTGQFVLEAQTPGAIGNQYYGPLLPIDYVNDLARAELAEVLVPGDDEESDEALRQRFTEVVTEPAFGGNVADYKQTIGAIDGVGAVKVFPVWQGGGTVKATIIASNWSVPAPALVDSVQTVIDPTVNSGQGIGTAPIGHRVTIAGVQQVTVNVVTRLTLADGMAPVQVQADVEAAIAVYLLELRRDWANQTQLVVRTAQIDARILQVQGVVDVYDTALNGNTNNVTLGQEEIPVMGTVTING